MLILCAVFFLLPFALRGARLAINEMQNDVTDWLPKSYRETEELSIFRKYFLGDQFVVITWPGCREDDPTYIRLLNKLKRESLEWDSQLTEEERRAREIGDQYAIYPTGNYHEDWAAHGERWLKGRDGWFFITRDGALYQWDGDENVVQAVGRAMDRFYNGKNKATGKFITRFEPEAGGALPAGENSPYYQDPTKFCARFFKSVTSGPEIFAKLAGEQGVLRLGKYDENDQATFDVKVEAHQKLSGLLFGPTPPPDFDWTFASLLHCLQRDYPEKIPELDDKRRDQFDQYVDNLVATRFNGDRAQLMSVEHDERLTLWFDLWDKLQLEAPKRQTCIVAYLNDPALDDLSRVVGRPLLSKPRGRILELASGQCGIDPDNLHLGGPPVDNVAIDEEGSITLLKLVGLSLFIGVTLAYVSFRSVKITIMLFFVGGVAAIGSLSIVWFGGSTLDAILMTMPSLVYVLGMSGAVHLVNYYQEAQHEDEERAVDLMLKHGWLPCSLAAFTTALGLLSLCSSYLTPIRKFGYFSAIATVATLVLLFTYLPAALYIWAPKRREPAAAQGLRARVGAVLDRVFDRMSHFVVRRHALIVGSFLLLMVVFGYGITQIQTTVHLLKLFDPNAKILRDYRWLEENIGALVPMEILVRVDVSAQREQTAVIEDGSIAASSSDPVPSRLTLDMLERAELSQRIRRELARVFGPDGANIVGAGTSADTFMPLYVVDSNMPTYRRAELARSLQERRDDISEDVDYFRVDPQDHSEYWRISLRLAALADVDYGQFVSEIRGVVEPILAAYREQDLLLQTIAASAQAADGEGAAHGEGAAVGEVAAGSANNRDAVRILLIGDDATQPNKAVTTGAAQDRTEQRAIFARTLTALLENQGFAPIDRNKKLPKLGYYWLTPAEFADLRDNGKNWNDLLARFEVVVGLDPHSGIEWSQVQSQSRHFVDLSQKDLGSQVTASELRRDDPDMIPITAAYTGIVPIVYKAQRSLLESLRESIVSSFAMIAVVMMVVLRVKQRRGLARWFNFSGGLVSMIPNVFPIVVVFGGMGLLGRQVDIGSMMTASVALGIAVDDTIHFLNWYRDALQQGYDRPAAIRETYRRVAKAMLQTTLIAGFGLSAFAFSTFTPTQRFGVMMLILLVFALIGDLILLPALLASPLGRCFGKPQLQGDRGGEDDIGEGTESVASLDGNPVELGLPGHSRDLRGNEVPAEGYSSDGRARPPAPHQLRNARWQPRKTEF